ncbi:MAG: hypothetical protein AB7S26_30055 [Sandaracinaceae bacterium]
MRSSLQRVLLGFALAGCSLIGDPGGMPEGVPHGGVGEFRVLTTDEAGIQGSLPGRAMFLRDQAIEASMRVGDRLAYAVRARVDMPPEVPADYPANEVFLPAFGPRTIQLGTLREEGTGAFDAGPDILVASEAWEGTDVFDPWILLDEDGTAHLYYAAEGGIGVAVAPSLDGTFAKRPGPIVEPTVVGRVVRHPSVVRGPDGDYLMYYDDGADLALARSTDGETFTLSGPLSISGDDDMADNAEARRAYPGAVRVDTRAGRTLIRVYFQSFRDDGTTRIYMIGSDDGETFMRYPRPVMAQDDVRFVAPYLVDDRITFMYSNFAFFNRGYQTRAVTIAVAPGGVTYEPPPM